MTSCKVFLLLLFVTCICEVLSTCVITSRSIEATLFSKSFGYRKIFFKSWEIFLAEGETIEAYCEKPFILERNSDFQNIDEDTLSVSTKISISCRQNLLYIDNELWNYRYLTFTCLSAEMLRLFELQEEMKMCQGETSLGFVKAFNEKDLIKVKVCLNLTEGVTKFLTYSTWTRPFDSDPLKESVSVLQQIENIEQYLAPQSPLNELPLNQTFEMRSVILDTNLDQRIDTNKRLVKVKFWNGLYVGNWELFKQAYQDHIEKENESYDFYSSTHGKLKVPYKECKEADESNDIPQYIWVYLKPSNPNATEDKHFVIVALNSPYYKVNETLEFCYDICDEIDWLKHSKFGKTHLMPIHGLTLCCRPNDVRDKLDFFPEISLPTDVNSGDQLEE